MGIGMVTARRELGAIIASMFASGLVFAQACPGTDVFFLDLAEPGVITELNPTAVAVEDLNGDQLPDLVTGHGNPLGGSSGINDGLVAVQLQLQGGGFSSPIEVIRTIGDPEGTQISAVRVGHFNSDAIPDIAAVTLRGGVAGGIQPSDFFIALGNGDGTFLPPFSLGGYPDNLTDLVIGDFDGDGKDDAAVCATFGDAGQELIVFWGSGFGPPEQITTYTGPLVKPTSVSAADINADGNLDLVVSDEATSNSGVFVFLNESNISFRMFAPPIPVPVDIPGMIGVPAEPSRAAAFDADGNGSVDLVVSSPVTGEIYLMPGSGGNNPMFGPPEVLFQEVGGTWFEVIEDIDGDGEKDLVVSNAPGNAVHVLARDGTGMFCELKRFDGIVRPNRSAVANIEGEASTDVDLDLVVASDTGSVGTIEIIVNGGSEDCDGNNLPDDPEDFENRSWNIAQEGSFHDEESWCPSVVPGPEDEVVFALDGVYQVEIGRDCQQLGCNVYHIRRLEVTNGMPQFDSREGLSTAPRLIMGDNLVEDDRGVGGQIGEDGDLTVEGESGMPATLELLSGTLQVGVVDVGQQEEIVDTVHIGVADGTSGIVFLNGSGSTPVLDTTRSRLVIGTGGSGRIDISRGELLASGITLGSPGESADEGGVLRVNGQLSEVDAEGELRLLSGRLEIENGGVVSGTPVQVLGGVISGDGGIVESSANIRGRVSPGSASGNGIGTLTFASDYTQRAGDNGGAGELLIDVRGSGIGEHDVITVEGRAEIAGGLTVRPVDGLSGVDSDPIEFLKATGSLDGQFDIALLPGLVNNEFLKLVYNRAGSEKAVALEVATLEDELGFGEGESNTFTDAEGIPTAARLADMDNDGLVDLVIALPADEMPDMNAGNLVVLLNSGIDGPDRFSEVRVFPIGVNPSAIAIGDLDGDNTNDIVVVHRGDNTVRLATNLFADVVLNFQVLDEFAVTNPTAVAIGNFDDDPAVSNDIAVAGLNGSGDGSVEVALNTALGTGSNWQGLETGVFYAASRGVTFMDIGDFDSDSCIDIFLTSDDDNGVNILSNNGPPGGQNWAGFASLGDPIETGDFPISGAVVDLDLDGDADLVVADRGAGELSVILNDNESKGELNLRQPGRISLDNAQGIRAPLSLTVGDYDTDEDADVAMVVIDQSGVRSLLVLRNDLDRATFQVQFSENEPGEQPNDPILVLSGDVNGDTTTDIVSVTSPTAPGTPRQGPNIPGWSALPLLEFEPCNAADLAEPLGTLDLADITAFISGFLADDPIADLDENGVFDLGDITSFVKEFNAGCP
jgi:hypothetical protein